MSLPGDERRLSHREWVGVPVEDLVQLLWFHEIVAGTVVTRGVRDTTPGGNTDEVVDCGI